MSALAVGNDTNHYGMLAISDMRPTPVARGPARTGIEMKSRLLVTIGLYWAATVRQRITKRRFHCPDGVMSWNFISTHA